MKKIALCVNHYHPCIGGSEYVVENVAKYMSNFCEVFVITPRQEGRNIEKYKPINVIEYIVGSNEDFLRKLNHIKPDSVMVYSDMFECFKSLITSTNFNIHLALCGASWLYKNPHFVNIINRKHNIQSFICHSTIDRDYKLCSNSEFRSRTHVIRNGVHTQEFDTNDIMKDVLVNRLGLPEHCYKKCWVLNVANFFPGKGQDILQSVIKRVNRDVFYIQVASDMSFTNIGKVLESKWIKNKDENSILLKNIKREYIIGLMKQSNVFAFTSEKEVAPITILESMTASLPWVSTNVGNVSELSGGLCIKAPKDSRDYSVFNDLIVDEFAENISKALTLPTIGDDGRRHVEKEFRWEDILPKYRVLDA